MKFNFDLADTAQERKSPGARTPPTPLDEVEWLPLHAHPVFNSSTSAFDGESLTREKAVKSLMVWDGASRLYFWDSARQLLHRISIRLGEPDEHSIIAASPSKVLRPDINMNFSVDKISINKNGSTLLLAGSDGLCVMYLSGRSSRDNSTTCRTVLVGSEVYSEGNGAISLLQSSWHPYSDTHVGVLSSDLVFRSSHLQRNTSFCTNCGCWHASILQIDGGTRICPFPVELQKVGIWSLSASLRPQPPCLLGQGYGMSPSNPPQTLLLAGYIEIFDVFSAPGRPEQEYYLQPAEPGRAHNAASICPVDFSFGRDHLWDRFSVFILFSDGSVFVICPVVPFGSIYMWDSVMEIYGDAQAFGLKSCNANAVKNSMLAISWLQDTFPSLKQEGKQVASSSAVKAQAYALLDASLLLQGPLRKVCYSGDEDQVVHAAECEGHAVSFLYSSVGKDSVLVTAWSGGQLQIDALADEIQPLWNTDSSPRLFVDSHDRILGYAMICEAVSGHLPVITLDKSINSSDWLGQPPPLLRLAIVDLALPKSRESDSLITMCVDPLVPEKIYALHDGGVDSVVLHFLPFTSHMSGKDQNMKAPSVYPVLSTNQGGVVSSAALRAFVNLSDSFGYSWVAGVTSSQECIVLEMKTWNLLLPLQIEAKDSRTSFDEPGRKDIPEFISKELLAGPKAVTIPHAAPDLKANADTVDGRAVLHRYFKLFHENYVEYAHKVYIELKHHGPHTKKIIENLDKRLGETQKRLSDVEKKHPQLQERIARAVQRHNSLEERLQKLRRLPGIHKKPLSRAEREFKAELDTFKDVELGSMQSSIDALNARLRKFTQSSKGHGSSQQTSLERRKGVPDAQLTQLKAALEKLSIVNSENTAKLKQIEAALKNQEVEDGS